MPTSAPGNNGTKAGTGGARRDVGRRPARGSGPGAQGRTGTGCGRRRGALGRSRGFTLIELLIVVAIVALASAVATLALRDPQTSALEREADRLSALLEAARAESRASGLPALWVPVPTPETEGAPHFHFVGLPAALGLPQHWLTPQVQAEVIGARGLVLGPEPLIGAQRVALRLGDRRLTLATDGLGPFEPERTDRDAPGTGAPPAVAAAQP